MGKAALGLAVVTEGGKKAGLSAIVIRNVLRIVDFLPFGYATGILAGAKGLLRQRIGDRAAQTVVVNRGGLETGRQWEA